MNGLRENLGDIGPPSDVSGSLVDVGSRDKRSEQRRPNPPLLNIPGDLGKRQAGVSSARGAFADRLR